MTLVYTAPACDNGCTGNLITVHYPPTHPHQHDSPSELVCTTCGRRIGRWCRNKLEKGEVEPVRCTGDNHPKL